MTNPQSFNRYAYAGNDPINFVDPTGLDPDCTDEFNNTGTCTITAGGSNATPPPGLFSDVGMVVVEPPSDGEIGDGGPQNTPPRRLGDDELALLRAEVEKALQSEKCTAFIDNLISYNTGKPYNSTHHFLDYLDKTSASAEGGIFFRWPGGGGITRTRKEDYAKILLPGLRPDLNVLSDAAILMYELIHALTEGSDDRLDYNFRDMGITPLAKVVNLCLFQQECEMENLLMIGAHTGVHHFMMVIVCA
jgi:hypothetical protein